MGRVPAKLVGIVVALAAVGCSFEVDGRAAGNCAELHEREPGATSGIHTMVLHPRARPTDVYCEMELGGGGWTLWYSPDTGTFAANEGMPRCGSLQQNDCVAGTFVDRGLREGVYLVYADGHVFELGRDLRTSAVTTAVETHGPCPDLSCSSGSTNCLFSLLKDGPGCCVDGAQNNLCLR